MWRKLIFIVVVVVVVSSLPTSPTSSSCKSLGEVIESCRPCEEHEAVRRRVYLFRTSSTILFEKYAHIHLNTHTHTYNQLIEYCKPTGFKQRFRCETNQEEEEEKEERTVWRPCEDDSSDTGLKAFLGFEVVVICVALVSGYYVWKTRRRYRAKKQSHLYSIIGTPSRK